MQNLYKRCLNEDNIKKAIKLQLAVSGSKTAGPDKITNLNIPEESKVITEVKKRLRGYKRVCSRKVEIPKKNGTRELTILNLYDRIAQQCVYQIIEPRLDNTFSKHSYGFRQGQKTKTCVSKLANVISSTKGNYYTIEIDFNKCFDNIPLDSCLNLLRTKGIRDTQLIKVIKRLMWTDKNYNGIGLGQGTILGPLLANLYLDRLDTFMESNYWLNGEHKARKRDYERNGRRWFDWLQENNKKISCRYYRYADDFIIVCSSLEEQQHIFNSLVDFINSELEITINMTKTKLGISEPINFLGYKIKQTKSVIISPSDTDKIFEELKKYKFNSLHEGREFMLWARGILNYYDICSNMSYIIDKMNMRLYRRSRKRHAHLKKEPNTDKYWIQGKQRHRLNIDLWELRKSSKRSIKDYCINSWWLIEREKINIEVENGYNIYTWNLYTRQQGIDIISKERLDIYSMEIHHKIPLCKGGTNSLDNLILINKSTHKLIHNNEVTENKLIKRYRKLL